MNEARVYADGFERSFAEVKDLLEFLAERGRNAKWIRKPTNTLRLAPLEKEAQNLDAADASMEEILEDTEKNTQLVLKMRGESYPVRDCAIRTILSRAGVNGDGLRKLDKATYAKVVNYCLRVAKGDALIKIADGKVSAVHGGDKHDYCILDMKAMFETTCEYLNLNFKGSVYMEGSGIYDSSIRPAATAARGSMIDIIVSIRKDITIIMAYVMNAVIAPTCIVPSSILCAPNQTIPTVSTFIIIIMPGIIKVMTRLVNSVVPVSSRFAVSKRSSSLSSLPNARITESPVRISRETRLMLSTSFCIFLNFGIVIDTSSMT